MTSTGDLDHGTEHFLTESLGLFNTTIYECRHCGERSPDPEYFDSITCPPQIDLHDASLQE